MEKRTPIPGTLAYSFWRLGVARRAIRRLSESRHAYSEFLWTIWDKPLYINSVRKDWNYYNDEHIVSLSCGGVRLSFSVYPDRVKL